MEQRGHTGEFVSVDGLGTGWLLESSGPKLSVQFFLSPAGPVTKVLQVAPERVHVQVLPTETLVYWHDDSELAWRMGRTQGEPVDRRALKDAVEDHYPIRFPGGDDRLLPQSELRVRWDRPLEDPTDLVAARVTESAYFVEPRRRLGRYIAAQRKAFAGLQGLSSAAIEYLPHQVAIIRRVLADPVRRYLLADEVGLGKTIEAGVLINQHLVEMGDRGSVEVVVPEHLRGQWCQELDSKFFLLDLDRVNVVTVSDLEHRGRKVTMLVVDEAHHACRWAFADEQNLRSRYEELCRRAMGAESVLLLSATPVLNEEDGFLAMLHIIDPESYRLSDRDSFFTRVRGRQTIANAIADLTDDAAEFFLEEVLSGLAGRFGDDAELSTRCRAVEKVAGLDENAEERVSAIRELRTYVSETYRLHRRLLRTRRDDATVAHLLPERRGLELFSVRDDARAAAAECLEDWRSKNPAADDSPEAADRFAGMVRASLSHPVVLQRELRKRRNELQRGSSPFFENELGLLTDWERSLEAGLAAGEPRARELAKWWEKEKKRAIIFVDDGEAAQRVCEELRSIWGEDSVARCKRDSKGELWKLAMGDIRALVIDGPSEEGLNLQELRAALFLYDIPFSPTRVEQRIGRMDRLEGLRVVRFHGFEPIGGYESANLGLLRDAARVFERSVAPLQYALGEAVSRIQARLLDYGADAIVEECRRLSEDPKESLDAELKRIRAQEALDSFSHDLDDERRFSEGILAAAGNAVEEGPVALRSWLEEALLFEFRGGDPFHLVHHQRGRFPIRPTLLPLFQTLDRFGDFTDPEERSSNRELPLGPFTFDPEVAQEDGASFLGLGHPFLEEVERQLRGDARGVAWSFWRQSLEWGADGAGVFLCFDFVVDLQMDGEALEGLPKGSAASALRLLGDSVFPPIHRSTWVGLDVGVVEDKALLRILRAPYRRRRSGGTDTNLRPERWLRVDEHCGVSDWSSAVGGARNAAEQWLRSSRYVLEAQEAAMLAVNRRLGRSSKVLTSRATHLSGNARESEFAALESEQLIADVLSRAVSSPQVRVDSCGAVILSKEAFPE